MQHSFNNFPGGFWAAAPARPLQTSKLLSNRPDRRNRAGACRGEHETARVSPSARPALRVVSGNVRAWFFVVPSTQDFDAVVAKLVDERHNGLLVAERPTSAPLVPRPSAEHPAGSGQSDDRELLSNDHLVAERPTSALLPQASATRGRSGNEAHRAQSPTIYTRPGSAGVAVGHKVAFAQASGATASMEGDAVAEETASAQAGTPAIVMEEDASSEGSCSERAEQAGAAATQDIDANADSDDAAIEIGGQAGDAAPEASEEESDDAASEIGGQTGDDDAAGEIGGQAGDAAPEALEDECKDEETPTNRGSSGLTGGANALDAEAAHDAAFNRDPYEHDQRTTGGIKRGCILYTWDKGLQQNKVPYWVISDATLNEPMIGEPMIGLLFVSSLAPVLVGVEFAWWAHILGKQLPTYF